MSLTVVAHIFGGGPEVNAPIQASDLDPVVRALALVVWHGVSVTLAAIAAALFWLSWHRNQELAFMAIGIQLGFTALFIGVGIISLGTLSPVPQWIAFAIGSSLTAWGLRSG